MRGACYLRCPGSDFKDFTVSAKCHIIEQIARQQRRVVGATFTAELYGGCDTQDRGVLLAQMLQQLLEVIIRMKQKLQE